MPPLLRLDGLLEVALVPVRMDSVVLKWMTGVFPASVLSLIVKNLLLGDQFALGFSDDAHQGFSYYAGLPAASSLSTKGSGLRAVIIMGQA